MHANSLSPDIRGQEPLTLKQVGVAIGVSKERIRQLQIRAMDKLRKAAKEDRIDRDMATWDPRRVGKRCGEGSRISFAWSPG